MLFQKTKPFKVLFAVFLVLIGGFVFLPLLWMINTALKPSSETFSLYFFWGPLTLENFKTVVTDPKILTYFRNSLLVSFASSFFATLVSAFAAYSFSKFRYRGRRFTMSLFMMSQAFPQAILLLSIYLMMQKLGLLGSYWALLLSYVTFTLPVGTWTLKSYFDGIPNALIESAKIDGAGQLRTMVQIVFPLAVPGMISIAIYGFVWGWNDLLYSLTLVTEAGKRTLAPGLVMTYMGEFTTNWGNMMAASVLVSIPVTIIFIFLQRYFIQGLTSGAVKG
ncbi:MAG: carbohydrate ABC transporter permease [Oscillospiraceae bacterium]